jgi:iron(III) transport system permease protein
VIGGKSTGIAHDQLGPGRCAGARALRLRARLLDPAALRRAAAHRVREELVGPGRRQLLVEHWRFVFLEFSQTKVALVNTFVLGASAATAGTILVVMT